MGLGSAIGNYLHNLAKGFQSGGDSLVNLDATIQSLFTAVDTIIADTQSEIDAFKNFQFDPKWKQRVINVPTAIDQTRNFILDLVQTVEDDYTALRDDVTAIKTAFSSIRVQTGGGALSTILNAINELSNFLTALVDAVNRFKDVPVQVQQIREEIEGLESLFLQQKNPRQWTTERLYKRQS